MTARLAPAPFLSRPVHPVTGKRIEIRARTRRELEARLHHLRSLRTDMRLGIRTGEEAATTLRGLERKRVTLLEAADSYAEQTRLAKRTRMGARNSVRDHGRVKRGYPVKGALEELAGERLEALTAPRMAKHFRKLAERCAWNTVNSEWLRLRAIVRHAAEQGWITAAPWGYWRPSRPTHAQPGRPRRECCRSAAERERLLLAAVELEARLPPSFRRPHFVAGLACALYTGARNGELAGLEWRDVEFRDVAGTVVDAEFDSCAVRIARQYDRAPLKEGIERIVVAPELAPYLRDLRAARGLCAHARDPIFPARSGGHMKQGNVIDPDDLRRVAGRAGLGEAKLWSPHSLRDSFVTIEAQRFGNDLRGLAERTGHRSIPSLLLYLQSFERMPRRQPTAPALRASTP